MDVLVLILAGGRGTRLDILSEKRSKPAVPFAGKFRIIDFALSNCSNSGMYNIAILTQYLPMSLNEHIGVGKPWDLDRRDSFVTLLQPSDQWYNGTADAVLKNISFIQHYNPKHVLILSGDHIYKMDYRKLLDAHIKNNADCTIACKVVEKSEASRFGIMETDENLKIVDFEEKPKEPKSNLASMGIYMFNTDTLLEYLQSIKDKDLDFGSHIIPRLINEKRVYAYEFYDYWKDVGTYESYLETSLLLSSPGAKDQLDMYDPNWKIYTRSEEQPAAKFGENARVADSLISNGCIVDGTVINSILSPGVVVEKGARIENSVIFNRCIIHSNAQLDHTILDKDCEIGKNAILGYGEDYTANEENPKVLSCGINVCGKHVIIPKDTIVERNCRIFSSSMPLKKDQKVIKSGSTLR